MSRRKKVSADSNDWNEYKKVDNKRNKSSKNETRNIRKQKLSEKKNFFS